MVQHARMESSRSKRKAILRVAVDHFGSAGYEHTKWATIAHEVGIGQTALYHYFESKAHCLLTIMSTELDHSHRRFSEAVKDSVDAESALRAAVRGVYDVTASEALQARILVHHVGILETTRSTEREEEERQSAVEHSRAVEQDWISLLARGMDSGEFPRRDEEELGRLILGMVSSVWTWHRPDGVRPLTAIGDSVADACSRLVH